MKTINLLVAILIYFPTNAFCQKQNNTEKELQEIPNAEIYNNISFDNLENYNSQTVSLSEFKGKLVIVDFWAKYCVSCIRNFSKIDSLQQVLASQVQFILVTANSKKEIDDLFSKPQYNGKLKMPKLIPSIRGDSVLTTLFDYREFPQLFFVLNKEGKIIKLFQGYAEPATITKLLAGNF